MYGLFGRSFLVSTNLNVSDKPDGVVGFPETFTAIVVGCGVGFDSAQPTGWMRHDPFLSWRCAAFVIKDR